MHFTYSFIFPLCIFMQSEVSTACAVYSRQGGGPQDCHIVKLPHNVQRSHICFLYSPGPVPAGLAHYRGGGLVITKKINPHTTQHGDSLAYLGQKRQCHHASKVNLKQWPKGSKIFSSFFTIIWFRTTRE